MGKDRHAGMETLTEICRTSSYACQVNNVRAGKISEADMKRFRNLQEGMK